MENEDAMATKNDPEISNLSEITQAVESLKQHLAKNRHPVATTRYEDQKSETLRRITLSEFGPEVYMFWALGNEQCQVESSDRKQVFGEFIFATWDDNVVELWDFLSLEGDDKDGEKEVIYIAPGKVVKCFDIRTGEEVPRRRTLPNVRRLKEYADMIADEYYQRWDLEKKRSAWLEILAHRYGYKDWNTLVALSRKDNVGLPEY
jgi:Glyoxalase superfamily protein